MSKKRRNESYDYLRRTYGVAGTGGQNRPNTGASTDSSEGTELSGRPTGVPAGLEVVEATECIVGYRMWGLMRVYPVGFLLASHRGSAVWPQFTRMEAECIPLQDDPYTITFSLSPYTAKPPTPHQTPDKRGKCWCGINAWTEGVPVTMTTDPSSIQVVGSVNLWGRVIEYKEGYRAQFAYPKELAVVGTRPLANKIATQLELAYGVPCQVWE